MTDGVSKAGLGILDSSLVHSALRSQSVARYVMRQPEGKRDTIRRSLAQSLSNAVVMVDPAKKGKLISEFRKSPEQDIAALADKLSKEPSGLKLSVYFPPELASEVQDEAEREGVRPAKWVQELVQGWLAKRKKK